MYRRSTSLVTLFFAASLPAVAKPAQAPLILDAQAWALQLEDSAAFDAKFLDRRVAMDGTIASFQLYPKIGAAALITDADMNMSNAMLADPGAQPWRSATPGQKARVIGTWVHGGIIDAQLEVDGPDPAKPVDAATCVKTFSDSTKAVAAAEDGWFRVHGTVESFDPDALALGMRSPHGAIRLELSGDERALLTDQFSVGSKGEALCQFEFGAWSPQSRTLRLTNCLAISDSGRTPATLLPHPLQKGCNLVAQRLTEAGPKLSELEAFIYGAACVSEAWKTSHRACATAAKDFTALYACDLPGAPPAPTPGCQAVANHVAANLDHGESPEFMRRTFAQYCMDEGWTKAQQNCMLEAKSEAAIDACTRPEASPECRVLSEKMSQKLPETERAEFLVAAQERCMELPWDAEIRACMAKASGPEAWNACEPK